MTVAAAAGLALLAVGAPSAAGAPSSDSRGYLDSTARCASTDATVAFGSTGQSRVAICSVSDGKLEYRGVRMRDGAKLVIPATRSGDGVYTAENAGIEYMITAKSLVLSVGEKVIREEPMVDFHGPGAAAAPSTGADSSVPPSPSKPLPPPLAAEVGGSASR
ncbi:hypothetical protein ACWDTP_24110 [Mycobacterium sp. NPDC003449]